MVAQGTVATPAGAGGCGSEIVKSSSDGRVRTVDSSLDPMTPGAGEGMGCAPTLLVKAPYGMVFVIVYPLPALSLAVLSLLCDIWRGRRDVASLSTTVVGVAIGASLLSGLRLSL